MGTSINNYYINFKFYINYLYKIKNIYEYLALLTIIVVYIYKNYN